MDIDRNVTLTPKAQWSLILFFVPFAINLLFLSAASRFLVTNGSTSLLALLLPIIVTLLIFSASIILGLQSLGSSKFPLLWVIPCMIMTILLAYTSWADFSRTRDSTKVVQISESSKNKEIGISLNPTQSNPTQIVAVFLNSPAEKSGLKNGDIIISIEGTEVSSRDEIVGFINTSDNPALDFVVKRNNENVSISVWRLP